MAAAHPTDTLYVRMKPRCREGVPAPCPGLCMAGSAGCTGSCTGILRCCALCVPHSLSVVGVCRRGVALDQDRRGHRHGQGCGALWHRHGGDAALRPAGGGHGPQGRHRPRPPLGRRHVQGARPAAGCSLHVVDGPAAAALCVSAPADDVSWSASHRADGRHAVQQRPGQHGPEGPAQARDDALLQVGKAGGHVRQAVGPTSSATTARAPCRCPSSASVPCWSQLHGLAACLAAERCAACSRLKLGASQTRVLQGPAMCCCRPG